MNLTNGNTELLATKQVYGAVAQGRTVVMIIGEKTVTMDHDTAFNLAAMLRHAAAQVKRATGDLSVGKIRGVATLTDANADEMRAQLSRDGTAVFVGRKPD